MKNKFTINMRNIWWREAGKRGRTRIVSWCYMRPCRRHQPSPLPKPAEPESKLDA